MKITKKIDAEQVREIRRASRDRRQKHRDLRKELREAELDLERLEASYARKKARLSAIVERGPQRLQEIEREEVERVSLILREHGYREAFFPTLKVDLDDSRDSFASWDDGKRHDPEADKKKTDELAESVGKDLADKSKRNGAAEKTVTT